MTDPSAPGSRRDEAEAIAYRFFSRALAEPPSPEWFAALRAHDLLADWPLRPFESRAASASRERLRAVVLGMDAAADAEARDDHVALFVGPGQLAVPPWESVHRSRLGLTFQEPTLAIRSFYRAHGLESVAIHREPDDHIALELAFLGELCDRLAQAPSGRQGRREGSLECAQVQLLEEHLLLWAPSFFEAVQEKARTPYFRALAALADATLAQTADRLGLECARGCRSDGSCS